jgi:hypothetical protein
VGRKLAERGIVHDTRPWKPHEVKTLLKNARDIELEHGHADLFEERHTWNIVVLAKRLALNLNTRTLVGVLRTYFMFAGAMCSHRAFVRSLVDHSDLGVQGVCVAQVRVG